MIRAADALMLPHAQLTERQQARVDALDAQIDETVRVKGSRRGVDMQINENDGDVIAELAQRLRRAGWSPQWHPLAGNVDKSKIVGYILAMAPSDAAHVEAAVRQIAVGLTQEQAGALDALTPAGATNGHSERARLAARLAELGDAGELGAMIGRLESLLSELLSALRARDSAS